MTFPLHFKSSSLKEMRKAILFANPIISPEEAPIRGWEHLCYFSPQGLHTITATLSLQLFTKFLVLSFQWEGFCLREANAWVLSHPEGTSLSPYFGMASGSLASVLCWVHQNVITLLSFHLFSYSKDGSYIFIPLCIFELKPER